MCAPFSCGSTRFPVLLRTVHQQVSVRQRMKSHCGGNSLHDLLIKYYIAWNHGKSPPRVLSTRNLGRAELQLQSSALRGPKVHEWPPLQYCLLSMFSYLFSCPTISYVLGCSFKALCTNQIQPVSNLDVPVPHGGMAS